MNARGDREEGNKSVTRCLIIGNESRRASEVYWFQGQNAREPAFP